MFQRVVVHQDVAIAISLFRVFQRPFQKGENVLLTQRAQFKDPGTGNERLDDVKIWVLRGRANQRHHAVFHVWKQRVLLGAIPAVHFINKQDGALAIEPPPFCRFINHPAQIRHAG